LLRLNVHPQFVQLMKLVQAEVGRGSEAVRPPRLQLAAVERDAVRELVRERLASRPALA
jgi:4-hydroxy-tetrahydrodipicolinate synthase